MVRSVFLMLVLLPAALFAQSAPGSPLNNLSVEIKLADGGNITALPKVELARGQMPMEERFADSRGHYGFRGLEDGEYTVTVSLPGYVPESRTMFLRYGNNAQMTFMLRRAAGDVKTTFTAAGDLKDSASFAVSDPLVDQRWLALSQSAREGLQQARQARLKKDFKTAIASARKVLDGDPKIVLAHQELGLAYWRNGETDKARQSFEETIKLDPPFLSGYLALADLLAEKKDYSGAGAVLLNAARAQPNRAEPFKAMAQIQLDTGHVDKAEQACQLALARDHSRVPELYVILANVYLRKGDKAKAAEALEGYLAKAPGGPMAEQVQTTLAKLKSGK